MNDRIRIDLDDVDDAAALPDPDAEGLIPNDPVPDPTEELQRVIREILTP
jgi:hypothetical protein